MQSYIFLDLDDTLFQTLRKCPTEQQTTLQARAYLADGTANSYATYQQQWLWHWLNQGFKIIPVTARDYPAFCRVTLPFQEEAVLNHGAVVLTNQRQVDKVWQHQIMQTLPDYQKKLFAVWVEVTDYAHQFPGFKPRLVDDLGSIWYGVVKHSDGSEATLTHLLESVIDKHAYVQDGSLYWHLNGNNLAVLPKTITKESAVAYLLSKYRQQHAELLTIGAGDSNSDAAFMALCDYALIPKNTQLFKNLFAK